MATTRTFLDANVLIAAFRGTGDVALNAQQVVDDPDRQFVASDILRLELLPKPHYHQRSGEVQFYEDFFGAVVEFIETTPVLVQDAEVEAKACGLAAADALHIAAAKNAGAQEFVTAERSTKPLFRVQGMTIICIRP